MNVIIAISADPTKMAQVIVTLRIMPESPETDLAKIEEEASKEITAFAGETDIKTETEPVAFGLNAVKITFIMDEAKGSTDALEETVKKIEGVNSVEAVDVRRAVG